MTPHNPNQGKFYHGEEIRCIGGPFHGQTNDVKFLFGPGAPEFMQIPCSLVRVPHKKGYADYRLDHKRRAWVYAPQKRKGPSHLYRANRKRRGRSG